MDTKVYILSLVVLKFSKNVHMHKFIITYLFVHCLLTHLLTFPFKLMQYLFE